MLSVETIWSMDLDWLVFLTSSLLLGEKHAIQLVQDCYRIQIIVATIFLINFEACMQCPGGFWTLLVKTLSFQVQPVTCCDLSIFFINMRYILYIPQKDQ